MPPVLLVRIPVIYLRGIQSRKPVGIIQLEARRTHEIETQIEMGKGHRPVKPKHEPRIGITQTNPVTVTDDPIPIYVLETHIARLDIRPVGIVRDIRILVDIALRLIKSLRLEPVKRSDGLPFISPRNIRVLPPIWRRRQIGAAAV